MHVFVIDHLVQITHRRTRHAVTHQQVKQGFLGVFSGEPGDLFINFVHVLYTLLQVGVTCVRQQVFALHGLEQRLPMCFADADDGDMAVCRRVDVVGRLCQAAVAVAGAWRHRIAHAVVQAQIGAERGIHGLLHRHLDQPTHARLFALIQRGHDGTV